MVKKCQKKVPSSSFYRSYQLPILFFLGFSRSEMSLFTDLSDIDNSIAVLGTFDELLNGSNKKFANNRIRVNLDEFLIHLKQSARWHKNEQHRRKKDRFQPHFCYFSKLTQHSSLNILVISNSYNVNCTPFSSFLHICLKMQILLYKSIVDLKVILGPRI